MSNGLVNSTFMSGVLIDKAYFNGVDLDSIYFNGVLVFTKILVIAIPAGTHNEGNHINLKKMVITHRHKNESEVIFTVAHGAEIPAVITGGVTSIPGISKVTFKNEGIISATIESGTALQLTDHMYFDNSGGVIRGGGGRGGVGGKGGKGHWGTTYTKTIPHSETKKGDYTGSVFGYWEGIPNAAGTNPGDHVFWARKMGGHYTGKLGVIAGMPGTFTQGTFRHRVNGKDGFDWNVYDIVHKWDTKVKYTGGTGGEGGAGGAGGSGAHYKVPITGGSPGHSGNPGNSSTPPGGGNPGSRGGTGGKGGEGGHWGKHGSPGLKGDPGTNHGTPGTAGTVGGKAGYSISGYSKVSWLHKGTLIGPTKG